MLQKMLQKMLQNEEAVKKSIFKKFFENSHFWHVMKIFDEFLPPTQSPPTTIILTWKWSQEQGGYSKNEK